MAGIKGQKSGGQNRKTAAEHLLAGTYRGHRHANTRHPEPSHGCPVPPDDLDGEARAEWDRMIQRLTVCQTLSGVDDAVLIRYCKLHARAVRIEAELARQPAYIPVYNADGKVIGAKLNPGFSQLRAHDQALRQFLCEFGLTPASRGRVALPANEEQEDPFERFMARGEH